MRFILTMLAMLMAPAAAVAQSDPLPTPTQPPTQPPTPGPTPPHTLTPTGTYNCPIAHLHRCRNGECKTRVIANKMEVSIDFDSSSACIRRGTECRSPRNFTARLVKRSLLLMFSGDGMVIRLTGTRMLGSEVTRTSVTTFEGTCARG